MSEYATACLISWVNVIRLFILDTCCNKQLFNLSDSMKIKSFNTRQESNHSIPLHISRKCSAVYNLPYFERYIYGSLFVGGWVTLHMYCYFYFFPWYIQPFLPLICVAFLFCFNKAEEIVDPPPKINRGQKDQCTWNHVSLILCNWAGL